jgi:hypothetical protein
MRMHTMAATGLVAALLVGPWVAPLPAQEWHAVAQGGRIRSALDLAAPTGNLALGLRYDDPSAGLRLTGGIPTQSTDALWAGLSAWKRLAIRQRGVFAGIDLSGNGFLTADRAAEPERPLPGLFDPPAPPVVSRSGHAVSGQALPVLGYERGDLQFYARAGLSRFAATFGQQRIDRSVRLGEVQLSFAPVSALAIVPVIRRFEAAGERATTYTGVSAVAASASGSIWGGVGQWAGGIGDGTPWIAGGRFRVLPLVALEASARHDAFDPLYLQPAQTSWSVGLSVLMGGRTRPVMPPVPAKYVEGRATIRLLVSGSLTRPSIAGDFNAWKPVPMQREGDCWTYTVALPRGVYQYAFISSSGDWFVPKDVPGRKDDGMGGHVAVLVVR